MLNVPSNGALLSKMLLVGSNDIQFYQALIFAPVRGNGW